MLHISGVQPSHSVCILEKCEEFGGKLLMSVGGWVGGQAEELRLPSPPPPGNGKPWTPPPPPPCARLYVAARSFAGQPDVWLHPSYMVNILWSAKGVLADLPRVQKLESQAGLWHRGQGRWRLPAATRAWASPSEQVQRGWALRGGGGGAQTAYRGLCICEGWVCWRSVVRAAR